MYFNIKSPDSPCSSAPFDERGPKKGKAPKRRGIWCVIDIYLENWEISSII